MNRNWQHTSGRLSIICVLKHSHLLVSYRCGSTDIEEQAQTEQHALQTQRSCCKLQVTIWLTRRHSNPACQMFLFCGSALLTKSKTNPVAYSNDYVNLSLWVSSINAWYRSTYVVHKLHSTQLCLSFHILSHTLPVLLQTAAKIHHSL